MRLNIMIKKVILIFLFIPQVILSQNLTDLEKYNGKIINNIEVDIGEIFENESNFLFKTVNKLKISTKKRTILNELKFKSGDIYKPLAIFESLRILRELKFLRRVHFVHEEIEDNKVNIKIEQNDTWTLNPQMSFSSGDGRNKRSIGLSDSNIFGLGKRLEVLAREDEGRKSIETVWDDRNFLGSNYQMLLGYFDRDDGNSYIFSLEKTFNTLIDRSGFLLSYKNEDMLGRLYENANENFIYNYRLKDYQAGYTYTLGDPNEVIKRFSFGYRHYDIDFSQASREDFNLIDVNPDEIDFNTMLAQDRIFSGPFFAYNLIEPEYITKNYIDKFERVQDYNIGKQISFSVHAAPSILGSIDDNYLFNYSNTKGTEVSKTSFYKNELRLRSRLTDSSFKNTLVSFSSRYYNQFGNYKLNNSLNGKHTLATYLSLTYGEKLNLDTQINLGADNGLRGYKSRTFNGDKSYLIHIEDRIHIKDNILQLFNLGTTVFLDIGGVTYSKFEKLFNDDLYADIGFGLRLAVPRSSGGKVFRVDFAFPLKDGPDGSQKFDPRIIISGSQIFSSYTEQEIASSKRASVAIGF